MSKYKCYDWNGNLIVSEINDLKEAVRQALKNECEVHDEHGDIIFSQWDGWNSDYPNIKNILIEVKYREGAPVADDDAIIELCEEASAAIIVTKTTTDFGVHHTPCGKELLRIPAFAFLYLLGNAEKHGYRGIE